MGESAPGQGNPSPAFHFLVEEALRKVLSGREISFDEALTLLTDARIPTPDLVSAGARVTAAFHESKADLCAIVSAKTGSCVEDCSFCSQSMHHSADAPSHPLLSDEAIMDAARRAREIGARRFCIVSQGRSPSERDFPRILSLVQKIRNETGLSVDCALGALTEEQAAALKSAGVSTYNHNIETAASFFPSIVRTHAFEDRVRTVRILKKAGINACCGGILNLGETPRQRIEFAFALRELDPEIVPINILNPRPGTPLEDVPAADPWEMVRTIAVFRLVLPKPVFKLAGGREASLGPLQSEAVRAGARGAIVGGYLTTAGGDPAADIRMFASLGLSC
ncbi:MAG: biotin synthase BioB [Nitrospirae bacterium RBG_16_64_22]|nr:MAG: biotin synthase BioB [Nitrospirae bacterium RBG_16_64_22]